jgi:purine nucleosidase
MPRAIIIDTDPGIDDAVAILLGLAAPELAVRGLVAVAGNVALAATERNARAVVELSGRRDIPVFAGCPRPLRGGAPDAAHVHGEEGLGRLVLPPPSVPLQAQHGVHWLIETLRAAPPQSMTLCALGPLTNIAVALVMAPDIATAIAELVIMGGGTRGNVTPAAEFNIHCDPQAAAIVFDSGLPITLVPLDATTLVRSTAERLAPLRRQQTRCAAAAVTLMTAPPGQASGGAGASATAMHDACVIAWLLAPELFRVRPAHVAIETQSPLALGMTLIDWRERQGRPNAHVLEAPDADGIYRLIAERLAALP